MTRHCKHGITGSHCADPECDAGRWEYARSKIALPSGVVLYITRKVVVRCLPSGGVRRDPVVIEAAYCRAGEDKIAGRCVIGIGPECDDVKAVMAKALALIRVEGALGGRDEEKWSRTVAESAVPAKVFPDGNYKLL